MIPGREGKKVKGVILFIYAEYRGAGFIIKE